MQRYHIVTRGDQNSENLKNHVVERLSQHGCILDEKNPELIISIGGDGTFLRAIHQNLDILEHVSFVGIHTGTLGFFTDYSQSAIEDFLNDVLTNEPTIHEVPLLKIQTSNGKLENAYFAINEMRVENIMQTQLMNVFIDGDLFETFRGTGMCISSQAGSTAYNRSLGGAILQEGLDFLQMTEITGIHHQAFRSLGSPLIIRKDGIIRLESNDFEKAILCYDHMYTSLEGISKIECSYCRRNIRFARYKNTSYLQRLKSLF